MPSQGDDRSTILGVLGNYVVDDTESFGRFINLDEHVAFVDLREDKYLELRKAKAIQLFENRQQLARSLSMLVVANPTFRDRRVAYIGLHSKDLEQGEVFWDPSGYTLLKGLSFELE